MSLPRPLTERQQYLLDHGLSLDYQEGMDLLGEAHALEAQAFQEKWGDPENMGSPFNPGLSLRDAENILEKFIRGDPEIMP